MQDKNQTLTAAERQQKFRNEAGAAFKVKAYTFLLTVDEAKFLRGKFAQKYGHGISIRERRKAAEAKARDANQSWGTVRVQLDLL